VGGCFADISYSYFASNGSYARIEQPIALSQSLSSYGLVDLFPANLLPAKDVKV
jgi:hypothetical protein